LIGKPAWYSKLRYSIQYDVPYDQVSKDNEPHDCGFMTAPIGEKNCHYEIEATKITTRTTNPTSPTSPQP
jgi:hypothetical protein